MTEQAFTLAMGDLRLDVGHEERSSKELPGSAYEHVSVGGVEPGPGGGHADDHSLARGGDGAFLGIAAGG
eukprot:1653614-Pleurochrysis_carterae.AAC.1